MCHPLSEVGLDDEKFRNVTRLKKLKEISINPEGREARELSILFGYRCKRCWYCLRCKTEHTKVLRLNAQSPPLFPTRLHENDCIDFHLWISVILIQRETVISVCRFASLICCCLFRVYVKTLFSNQNFGHRVCSDSPTPADTNGTAGNGNQSSDHAKNSANQNGGDGNYSGSNGDDGSASPPGGCDGGSSSGGGDDGEDNRNNSNNSGSEGDEVEERENDDDEGNETQEEEMDDEDAAKENTEPPSQLSLVPEAVIEAAGGMAAIDDELGKLLVRRIQPIYELVDSEQNYQSKLSFVAEKYIPAASEGSPIEIPEALAQKWRILWGNWIQLNEWHTNFYQKLEAIFQTEPDRIPKLFIDSRARLRSIYSKYCENQRKATLIADQYREFFEELRVKVGDKEDVQSHLMRPVQRIMRYQLPMGEILKLTERAGLPSSSQWQKALDIMKEIPKDTQMILEAARIEGFGGTITALGNMRIRGDLQVATISGTEFRARGEARKDRSTMHPPGNGGEGSGGLELKFAERRVFLFEQMLLITEEVKSKRRDAFAQSTYVFKHAVNVNRMSFEPHWQPMDADIDPDDDDLKFVVIDTSPTCDAAYVLDPGTVEIREQWVIQLRDLQRMQQQLLLALQDPKRYVGGSSEADDGPAEASPSPGGTVSGLRSFLSGGDKLGHKKQSSAKSGAGGKKKKFPSLKKGKQRSKTEELPVTSLSACSGGTASGDGTLLDVNTKGSRKESCPNTLQLSVLITPGDRKQVDSRKGTVGSDVQHQSTAGALIAGRASAEASVGDCGADTDPMDAGAAVASPQVSHPPSKKKFSVFSLFGKNKHHHHHQPHHQGIKDQQTAPASSPTSATVPANTAGIEENPCGK